MICTYIYKGNKFNSEAELDDFLLEKDKYLSQYGDIVFSMTSAQTSAYNSLDQATKTAVATKAQAKWKTAKKIYTEDGVYANIKPYMGVNEFLEGLTNSDDKLFFPEFVENNYWTKRFLDWAEGKYTEDEQELFGFTADVKPKFDVHPDLLTFKGEDLNEVSTEEQKKLRAKMEEKWKNQALFGDVVHFIGQKLFSKIETGPNAGKLWIDIVDTQRSLFDKQIDVSK